jgi:CHAD domain-containing protein
MFAAAATPHSLLRQQLTALQSHVPSVLEGDVAAVHDARVVTRRIRQLLPLTTAWHSRDAVDSLYQRFRRVGRALGRVRDADVQIELLRYFESRVPAVAPSLVVVRLRQERKRLKLMRQVIKELEQDHLPDLIEEAGSGRLAGGPFRTAARRWRPQLRSMLAARARVVEDAVRHATGVYFPNRVHSARIAIKKLRYAVEIAEATASGRLTETIRDLKKAQEILGHLHDRESLVDRLSDEEVDKEHADLVALVTQVVQAEIGELHRRYLARRERVLEIAREAAGRPVRAALAPVPLMMAAGAVALSSGLVAARRSLAPRP